MEPPYDAFRGVISTDVRLHGGNPRKIPATKECPRDHGAREVGQACTIREGELRKLLEVFWKNVDPTVRDRQFCDIGASTHPIFHHTASRNASPKPPQKVLAKTKPFRKISSHLFAGWRVLAAEDYHQDFYVKNPVSTSSTEPLRSRCQVESSFWGSVPH